MKKKYYYKETYQTTQFRVERLRPDSPDLNIIDDQMISDKRILVIGCGTGYDVSFLVTKCEVVGLDLMSEAVRIAKHKRLVVIQADVEIGLPFIDKSFDIIVCKDVLEHLFDPLSLLREVYRIMRDDGYVYVIVPNQLHWWYYRFRILLGKNLLVDICDPQINEWNYFHIRFFTSSGFKSIVKVAKMKIAKLYYHPNDLGVRYVKLLPKSLALKIISINPSFFCQSIRTRLVKDLP